MSRILIADDAPDAAETLAVYLRMDGHEVRTAADGVEALAKMAVQPPDVLVVDLLMPRKNGWEVLDEMAARPELARSALPKITETRPHRFRRAHMSLSVVDGQR